MGYHVGEAAGLLAGSQTISAVIGVASDTINQLGISEAQKATYINAIPVAYAVTFGQRDARGLCGNLYFRYGRLGMALGFPRPEDAGWTGQGKGGLQSIGSTNGDFGSR